MQRLASNNPITPREEPGHPRDRDGQAAPAGDHSVRALPADLPVRGAGGAVGITRYLGGQCHVFASVLSAITGWPMEFIWDVAPFDTDVPEVLIHAWCVRPDGKRFDAGGETSMQKLEASEYGDYGEAEPRITTQDDLNAMIRDGVLDQPRAGEIKKLQNFIAAHKARYGIADVEAALLERAAQRIEAAGKLPTVVYHGTSTKQFARLKDAKFVVRNFYVGDSLDNIAANYAERESKLDGSEPVVLQINTKKIGGLQAEPDFHGDVEQTGQWILSGDISRAITGVDIDWAGFKPLSTVMAAASPNLTFQHLSLVNMDGIQTGKIIAICDGQHCGHLTWQTKDRDKKSVDVGFIKVDESMKRQGIGTALIKELQKKFPGRKLTTDSFTKEGRPFWKSLGLGAVEAASKPVTIELLCRQAPKEPASDPDMQETSDQTEQMWQRAETAMKKLGVSMRTQFPSDDDDSYLYGDAYVYVEPDKLLEVLKTLEQNDVEFDNIDLPAQAFLKFGAALRKRYGRKVAINQTTAAATNKDGPMFLGNPAGAMYLDESGYDVLQSTDERDTWMTPANEKKLVGFANGVAKELGLNKPCIGFTLSELHDGDAVGVFISGTESEVPTIIIDVSSHRTSSEITDTVAHELAHAFQWTQLSQDEWDLDDAEEIAENFCRDVRSMGLKKAAKLLMRACDAAIKLAYGSSYMKVQTVAATDDVIAAVAKEFDSWVVAESQDGDFFYSWVREDFEDNFEHIKDDALRAFVRFRRTKALYDAASAGGISDEDIIEMIKDRAQFHDNRDMRIALYTWHSGEEERNIFEIPLSQFKNVKLVAEMQSFTRQDWDAVSKKLRNANSVEYLDPQHINLKYDLGFEASVGLSERDIDLLTEQIEEAIRGTADEVPQSKDRGPATDNIVYRVKHEKFAGYYLADLPPSALADEGEQQRICVGDPRQGYIGRVQKGSTKIMSLRNPNGKTLLTFEIIMEDGKPWGCAQIKGKANRLPGFNQAGGDKKYIKPEESEVAAEILKHFGLNPKAVDDYMAGAGQKHRPPPSMHQPEAAIAVHCGFCRRPIASSQQVTPEILKHVNFSALIQSIGDRWNQNRLDSGLEEDPDVYDDIPSVVAAAFPNETLLSMVTFSRHLRDEGFPPTLDGYDDPDELLTKALMDYWKSTRGQQLARQERAKKTRKPRMKKIKADIFTYDNLDNTRSDKEFDAHPDLSVPPYDRRQNISGHYAVMWLTENGVIFSSRCRDFGEALRMTRQHKRVPTWIISGLERELDVAQLCLSYRSSDWLDARHMDHAVRGVIQVVGTQNLPEPSKYIQPKLARR